MRRSVGCIAFSDSKWTGQTSVEVRDPNDGDGLSSFFTIPEYRKLLEDKTINAIDILRLNGVRALKIELDSADSRHCQIYFAIAGGRSYVIVSYGEKVAFEKRRKEIDAIVASFKILPDKPDK